MRAAHAASGGTRIEKRATVPGKRMDALPVLALGFFLGMRHATDSDHVVAVTTIVSREKSLRAASVIGALWGIGHSVAILVAGGAIVLFDLVLPQRIGLTMELAVAIMLVLLGLWNVISFRRDALRLRASPGGAEPRARYGRLRSLVVGTVHGLAGSAALGLLVLTTIRTPMGAVAYLLLFGLGTVVGMMLITSAMALPIIYTARKVSSWNGHIGWVTGVFSVALGLFLTYQIGFVDGLFRTGLPLTHQ
jgi:hypothetical protein